MPSWTVRYACNHGHQLFFQKKNFQKKIFQKKFKKKNFFSKKKKFQKQIFFEKNFFEKIIDVHDGMHTLQSMTAYLKVHDGIP